MLWNRKLCMPIAIHQPVNGLVHGQVPYESNPVMGEKTLQQPQIIYHLGNGHLGNEPTIVCMRKSQHGTQNVKTHNRRTQTLKR